MEEVPNKTQAIQHDDFRAAGLFVHRQRIVTNIVVDSVGRDEHVVVDSVGLRHKLLECAVFIS